MCLGLGNNTQVEIFQDACTVVVGFILCTASISYFQANCTLFFLQQTVPHEYLPHIGLRRVHCIDFKITPAMTNIQIQIMSDLHLEAPAAYDVFDIPPKAPILALLGDIGQARDPGWIGFVERQHSLFRTVLLVLGNHEPYHSDWNQVRLQVKKFNEDLEQRRSPDQGSLILLDKSRLDISQEVTILGCTLHSLIDAQREERISFGMNDFYHIGGEWDVSKHRQAHRDEVAWLNDQVASIEQKAPYRRIAILTHHSPCINNESMNPRHASGPLVSAFATDLTNELCWTSQMVKLWAFGHTHYNCSFEDTATGKQIVTNQRGYYFSQATGFDIEKVFTI